MRQSVQMQWWSNLQSCCDSFSEAHSQGQYRCTRPSQEELLYRYFLYFNINPRFRSFVDYLWKNSDKCDKLRWKLGPLFLILWKNWCISSNYPWFLQFDSQPSRLATQRWHKEQCFERAGLTRSQDRQCAMWKICSSHCAVWSSQGNRNSKSFTARQKGSGWWFQYMEKWKPCSKPPTRVLSSNHVVFLFAFHTFVHPFFLMSSKCGQNSRLPLVADLLHILIRDGARIRLRRQYPDPSGARGWALCQWPRWSQKNGLCAPG